MIERAIAFGENDCLVGTICLPIGAKTSSASVGVILFNAGFIHRIGPHRLNVRLARRLASHGIPTIRFDLAGVGDSARAASRRTFETQAVVDLQAAMDVLGTASRTKRFSLFGFCSGAYHGYAASLIDERIVGLFIYDAYRYATVKSSLNRYQMRIRQHGLLRAVGGWAWRTISAIWTRIRGRGDDARTADVGFITKGTSKAELASGLRKLADRGVKIAFVFSGGAYDIYNYRNQFFDAFNRFGTMEFVSVEFLPELDHVATSIAGQTELMNCFEVWIKEVAPQICSAS